MTRRETVSVAGSMTGWVKDPGSINVRSPTASATRALKVPRETETLRKRTVEMLRNAILDLRFQPGDRLIERELCELTGVSRTSVREALRHLESEGLVHTVPYRGPVVASITPEDARQIYEVRMALEGLAGRLFAKRARSKDVAALTTAARRYERAIRQREVKGVLAALTSFYDIVFTGSGNAIVASLLRSLGARMQFLRATTALHQSDADTEDSVANFWRIVGAAESRDPERMQAACVHQVRHAAAVAVRVLGAMPASDGEPRRGSLGAVRKVRNRPAA